MKVKHIFNDILLKERKSVGWFLLCYYLDGYRQNNQKLVKNLSLFFFFLFYPYPTHPNEDKVSNNYFQDKYECPRCAPM